MDALNLQNLFDTKICLLNQIVTLLDNENSAINSDDGDLLDSVICEQNGIVEKLKELDIQMKIHKNKIPGNQNKIMFEKLSEINLKKKKNIESFKKKFESFKKKNSTVFYNRELMNTYFHRVPLNPRFIDTQVK